MDTDQDDTRKPPALASPSKRSDFPAVSPHEVASRDLDDASASAHHPTSSAEKRRRAISEGGDDPSDSNKKIHKSLKTDKAKEVSEPFASIVHRSCSLESVTSDLSSASAATQQLSSASPSMSLLAKAPPTTPASETNAEPDANHEPLHANLPNAESIEQQFLAGAATPAPTRPAKRSKQDLTEDFSEWAVGDRYEMMRILGKGSYGEVAQAVDKYAGKPDAFVAIKRIQSPFDQEIDAIRMYREIHLLRLMRGHQSIIQLLDVVQPPTDDLDDFHDLYLVFEYVDTDLHKLILSPQFLSIEHVKAFAYQMLLGIKYIHSFSVIHRDLKPANILLNEDCSLKICDFGLARIFDPDAAFEPKALKEEKLSTEKLPKVPRVGLTRQLTKHVVTRWYRAPELILIQPYTSAVDIWSLGCIIAELLSMQEGNVPGFKDRKPLFPGGKCFPLSGDAGTAKGDERLDQLSTIFGVIGTPSKEDIERIGEASKHIQSLGRIDAKPLKELFPASPTKAVDLLQKMLLFNPAERITATEALEHPFFADVRQTDLEISADAPLQEAEFLDLNKVDLRRLKKIIFDEVRWYRDNTTSPTNTKS